MLAFWIICGIIAAMIAMSKGSGGFGFAVVGFLLGPLGIIIALLASGNQCPYCKKKIHKNASVCPHCQKDLKKSDPENDQTKDFVDDIEKKN